MIIDCNVDDLGAAADFWAQALGAPAKHTADLNVSQYVELNMPADDVYVEVQKVEHASRVHIDIEADDIEAEVARLESLGAKRLENVRDFVVLEAPTGQRFCVVPVVSAEFASRARVWGEDN